MKKKVMNDKRKPAQSALSFVSPCAALESPPLSQEGCPPALVIQPKVISSMTTYVSQHLKSSSMKVLTGSSKRWTYWAMPE